MGKVNDDSQNEKINNFIELVAKMMKKLYTTEMDLHPFFTGKNNIEELIHETQISWTCKTHQIEQVNQILDDLEKTVDYYKDVKGRKLRKEKNYSRSLSASFAKLYKVFRYKLEGFKNTSSRYWSSVMKIEQKIKDAKNKIQTDQLTLRKKLRKKLTEKNSDNTQVKDLQISIKNLKSNKKKLLKKLQKLDAQRKNDMDKVLKCLEDLNRAANKLKPLQADKKGNESGSGMSVKFAKAVIALHVNLFVFDEKTARKNASKLQLEKTQNSTGLWESTKKIVSNLVKNQF